MTDSADRTVPLSDGGAIPAIGFGTWQLTGDDAYRAVRRALDVGYRHIDTATVYGNEQVLGRAIADSGVPRDELFVTTKLAPEHVDRAARVIDESLRALRLDQVDLWLVHWPPGGAARPDVWRDVIAARDAGKAVAIGVSNYSPAQIDELVDATGVAPVLNQIPFSPPDYDQKLVDEHAARGVVLESYSTFKRSNLDEPVLREIADAHGVDVTQVILRWHVDHGFVAIPKSADDARIARNFDVWGFSLTDEELARIDALGR